MKHRIEPSLHTCFFQIWLRYIKIAPGENISRSLCVVLLILNTIPITLVAWSTPRIWHCQYWNMWWKRRLKSAAGVGLKVLHLVNEFCSQRRLNPFRSKRRKISEKIIEIDFSFLRNLYLKNQPNQELPLTLHFYLKFSGNSINIVSENRISAHR